MSGLLQVVAVVAVARVDCWPFVKERESAVLVCFVPFKLNVF